MSDFIVFKLVIFDENQLIMQKQIFIQDKKDKTIYHSLTEVIKIEIPSQGNYDLYFRNGDSIRVSQYFNGINILDIVELVKINN